jgi:hypothetical protein
MKVFRNLLEAINSLEKGRALVSKFYYLFNPDLSFYQKDVFGDDLDFDKYKKNRDLGYRLLGLYVSEFGMDLPELELIFSDSLFVRSYDLLRILGKLDDSSRDLKALSKEPVDFVESSVKILSSLTSSFDFLVFSSFKGDKNGNNLLISGIYEGDEGEGFPDFSGFWKNLLFGNSGAYEKLLSVFDENFREYVLSSIVFYYGNRSDYFSLPFASFSEDTRFLFLEKSNFGRRVGLVSIDQRLSSEDISDWFTKFLTNRKDISPKIIGCLDLYYYFRPKLGENVVLIPVELNKRGRKILVLHAFLVVDLLDDHFRFYVDVRDGSALRSDYILRLYPNKDSEDRRGLVLNATEYISFGIDGLDGANLSATASFRSSSVGETVEIGGNKEMVPRGLTPKYDSLDITIYDFSMNLDEKLDLSAYSPNDGEMLSLAQHRSGYIIRGRIWKNKRFVNAIRGGIKRFERKFLSDLPSSCFLSSEGEKPLSVRDKKFLLKMVELIFRETIRFIKERLNKCVEDEKKCEFRPYIEVDEEKYGKDTIRITKVDYRPDFARIEATSERSKDYLREIFEERTLYSKLIGSLGESVAKLCFEHGRGNRVEIDTGLPLHENEVKDLLKIKSYLGFINWSLRGLGEIREDQAKVYSVFLDLVPHDPGSVRFLHSQGIYDKIRSKLKRVIQNLEEALEKGTINLNVDLKVGIKARKKEDKICISPWEGDYFIGDLTLGEYLTYKQGKILIEIEIPESR